jgi:type I restriction enzyme M protein
VKQKNLSDYKRKNMFCNLLDLTNEAQVESLFVDRFLKALDYPDNRVKRKESITEITIGKGVKKENYRPDYVLLDPVGKPIIVIDAKSPHEKIEDYHYQISSYALFLNQKYHDENPVRYAVLTNGIYFIVYPWDSEQPVFYLGFEDFNENKEKWLELRSNISYSAFKQIALTQDVFHFERPELTKLIRTFNDTHNLIRKKDSLSPTDAFYEFSKLTFIKIREDSKIHEILKKRKPKESDFIFSTNWIDSQSTIESNPIDSILFRQIRDELERKIKKGEKKRIFEKDERLKLKAETIYEVVKSLQHYDLYGIDEDLNGRMFETFLNATVRGKDLGQFFTPRGVVHYMVETSPHKITIKSSDISENIPFILDGCCGSGGFLIDMMAEMLKQIESMKQLTNTQKEEYKDEVKNHHLFGIDSTDKIARVGRLNMYLHGDGGSKIFKANSLDKDLIVDLGLEDEEKEGIVELKKFLNTIEFDVVLTNPPFSITYHSSDEKDKRFLLQYDIAKSEGRLTASKQSNVLFLERYKDLLKEGTGELLTIIDDTVLNGEQSQRYRKYIFDNFIIRQIVSLPFNTFFRADANIKTSMIHLRLKKSEEKQGEIFMAITNNIGHDDHQRETPARNNLPIVAKYYNEWSETGNKISKIIHNEDSDEPLGCPLQIFTISPQELNEKRLDAFYYAPELKEAKKQLEKLSKDGKIIFKKGSDFNVIKTLKKKEVEEYRGRIFKYIEIGDVTIDGTIVKSREDYFENLPTRARLQVQENDIIFAKNNSSRGTTVLVPKWYNGQLVTTGFIGVRPSNYEESLLLWSIMESDFFRKQIYYLAITASQPEVRENIFREEILIPYPKTKQQRDSIIRKAKLVDDARNQLNKSLNDAKKIVGELFFS